MKTEKLRIRQISQPKIDGEGMNIIFICDDVAVIKEAFPVGDFIIIEGSQFIKKNLI